MVVVVGGEQSRLASGSVHLRRSLKVNMLASTGPVRKISLWHLEKNATQMMRMQTQMPAISWQLTRAIEMVGDLAEGRATLLLRAFAAGLVAEAPDDDAWMVAVALDHSAHVCNGDAVRADSATNRESIARSSLLLMKLVLLSKSRFSSITVIPVHNRDALQGRIRGTHYRDHTNAVVNVEHLKEQ